jgi:hypothetical protein
MATKKNRVMSTGKKACLALPEGKDPPALSRQAPRLVEPRRQGIDPQRRKAVTYAQFLRRVRASLIEGKAS